MYPPIKSLYLYIQYTKLFLSYRYSFTVQVSESSDFYGHSDRRGVINKSTKLFTRAELREMLKKIKDDSPSDDIVPLLTSTPHKEGNDNLN